MNVCYKEMDRQSSKHQLRKKNKVNLKGDDKNK